MFSYIVTLISSFLHTRSLLVPCTYVSIKSIYCILLSSFDIDYHHLCCSIYFARHKEYMICLISFSKFSDVLFAFTCARAIGNILRICLRVHIFRLEWSETFYEKSVPSILIENILLSKVSIPLSLHSKNAYKFLRIFFSFFFFFSRICGLFFFLKSITSTNKLF